MAGFASPLSLLVVSLVSGVVAAAVTHVGAAEANPSGVSRQRPTLPPQPESTGPQATAQLHGKWALYEVKKKGGVGANAMATLHVDCKDADDVPVAASCYSTSGDLVGTRHRYWADNSRPAQSQCTHFNDGNRTLDAEITMICQRIDVPKPAK